MENEVLRGELVNTERQDLTESLHKVKVKDEVFKYLEKEYVVKKLKQIEKPRDHLFLSFLWMTGVRVSEAIAVQKQHINFERDEIKILWQKRKEYKWRTHVIPPTLTNLLRFYTSSMKYDEKLFDFTRQNADLICKKWFGSDTSCHMIRHSYAVNYMRQAKSPQALLVLQRLLGHASYQTTMKYLHVVPNDMHEGISDIEFY